MRRLLRGETGPSGGPAMTDVLGTCLAWEDGTCVVQPREGDPVTVAVADIVAGKPVPPKPAVRMRVTTPDAEAHTTSLFPDVETAPLGAWTLRWQSVPDERPRKRANSCLAVTAPGMSLTEALDAVSAHYAGHGRTPLVQVEQGSDTAAAVATAGWEVVPGGNADFLLTSAAMLRRELRGVDPADAALEEADGRVVATTHSPAGTTLARARAALDGDWFGIHDVWVDPDRRRGGLATRLLADLLDWGASQGARTVWLHVETDNAAALALYEGLGFTRHHTCSYLAPAGWSD